MRKNFLSLLEFGQATIKSLCSNFDTNQVSKTARTINFFKEILSPKMAKIWM